jgi:hypothetical protein
MRWIIGSWVLLGTSTTLLADHRAGTVGDPAVTALHHETNLARKILAARYRSHERGLSREAAGLERSGLEAERQTARLLRKALAAACEEPIDHRFEQLLRNLQARRRDDEPFRRAIAGTRAQVREQQDLLLLLQDAADESWLRSVQLALPLRALNATIRNNKLLRARTERRAQTKEELLRSHDEAVRATRSLARDLARLEPAVRRGDTCRGLIDRVVAAQGAARRRLEAGDYLESADDLDHAIGQLERLRGLLEQVLRQFHEVRIESQQLDLEDHTDQLLALQSALNARTLLEARDKGELGAKDLADRQALIVSEMNRVIKRLDDPTLVVLPEVLRQTRDDMANVERRLRKGDTGARTQQLEQDIVQVLDVLRGALTNSLRHKGPRVLDVLGELKLIRRLQLQINRRLEQDRDDDSPESQAERKELQRRLERLEDFAHPR